MPREVVRRQRTAGGVRHETEVVTRKIERVSLDVLVVDGAVSLRIADPNDELLTYSAQIELSAAEATHVAGVLLAAAADLAHHRRRSTAQLAEVAA